MMKKKSNIISVETRLNKSSYIDAKFDNTITKYTTNMDTGKNIEISNNYI